MGGIAKTINRAFGGRRPKSGQSTIMTSPRGLENEANVGRTVLGGGSRTERRRMM
jgi:hypothetical protein